MKEANNFEKDRVKFQVANALNNSIDLSKIKANAIGTLNAIFMTELLNTIRDHGSSGIELMEITEDGWVSPYKISDILSAKEQEDCIVNLSKLRILDTKIGEITKRRWFHIDLVKYYSLLAAEVDRKKKEREAN